MPRPKGSKNKAKVTIPANDFDTLISKRRCLPVGFHRSHLP